MIRPLTEHGNVGAGIASFAVTGLEIPVEIALPSLKLDLAHLESFAYLGWRCIMYRCSVDCSIYVTGIGALLEMLEI